MSSQDSDGESYVSHHTPDPNIFRDTYLYLWATDEEEDTNVEVMEDASSDEDELPLPQPGDMHVEFKKSSLPNRSSKSKVQFIMSRFLHENKVALCKKILKLEQENDDLREERFILKRKLEKLAAASSTSSPPPPKNEI
jgi:hypothetical protein